MLRRFWLTAAMGAAATVALVAQAPSSVPRTADGRPDFEGTWYFGTATPLERPVELAGKSHFGSQAEAAEFERQTAARIKSGLVVHPPDWLDYGTNVVPDLRTSLIVDPPDGRVPPLTAAAQARVAARRASKRGTGVGDDDPEQRSLTERCLVFGAGPPLVPGPYNNNLRIVQTAGHVVLFSEMIHDARIVSFAARPPLAATAKFWLGSSTARWEGDALVIETTHFNDQVSLRGSDEQLKVTERLTLVTRDSLRYEYTVDDPTAFTRPWTAVLPMVRTDEPMYEYACHEGNHGLLNTLTGARAEDRERRH